MRHGSWFPVNGTTLSLQMPSLLDVLLVSSSAEQSLNMTFFWKEIYILSAWIQSNHWRRWFFKFIGVSMFYIRHQKEVCPNSPIELGSLVMYVWHCWGFWFSLMKHRLLPLHRQQNKPTQNLLFISFTVGIILSTLMQQWKQSIQIRK